ncbi:DUF5682 family protein [Psychrobacter sp. I-STPA6b]|uniref:DUF5682 family protein n=1 Tax=Psychrobacter sp. I-STPA6b TaxID=2585718 RepID=UPI001D0C27B9|nr:DUF5682 family protein [Psychrobacter sp. I-STPA6b]
MTTVTEPTATHPAKNAIQAVHFIGIRHHSPVCATLVQQWILTHRPAVVLIEAPSDIKPQLAQFFLPHQLPIALYSYRQERVLAQPIADLDLEDNNLENNNLDAQDNIQTAQSWFPLLDYSPEWLAIQTAGKINAEIDFIDLPHWSYRASIHHNWQDSTDNQSPLSAQSLDNDNQTSNRYHHVLTQLLEQTGCDNQDALWERWFEQTTDLNHFDNKHFDNKHFDNKNFDNIETRLAYYFDVLRGDAKGSIEDRCREGYMAQWIAYHQAKLAIAMAKGQQNKQGGILVVCGGWHINGIKQQLNQLQQQLKQQPIQHQTEETLLPSPPDMQRYVKQFFQLQHGQSQNRQSEDNKNNADIKGVENKDSNDYNDDAEFDNLLPRTQIISQGNYLIPFSFKQVESLMGYGAGMPSPQYYQWLFDAKMNHQIAHDTAMIAICQAIRQAKQPLSTATLTAWQHSSASLAALRGLATPSRQELLDAMLSCVVNDTLPTVSPWNDSKLNHASNDGWQYLRLLHSDDHPLIRLALTTLTGQRSGKLAQFTPTPPLLIAIETLLQRFDLMPTDQPQMLKLSYRDPVEREKLHILWQLSVLNISSVQLITPNTNQQSNNNSNSNQKVNSPLATEQWQLHKNVHWQVELIQASRYGASLAQASQTALNERFYQIQQLPDADSQIDAITQIFSSVIHCGFDTWSAQLITQLERLLPHIQKRQAISRLGNRLISMQLQGFWGQDIERLLAIPLILVIQRLLWLVDGDYSHSNSQHHQDKQADITSIQIITHGIEQADRLNAMAQITLSSLNPLNSFSPLSLPSSQSENLPTTQVTPLDPLSMCQVLQRLSLDNQTSATLRGSAVGSYQRLIHQFGQSTQLDLVAIDLIGIIKSVPVVDKLGDFLLGLFATARHEITRQANLLDSLHQIFSQINDTEFLTALPSLRQAFGWFPPRERQQLAKQLASIMGLNNEQAQQWQRLIQQPLPQDSQTLARQISHASSIEQQTLAYLQQIYPPFWQQIGEPD